MDVSLDDLFKNLNTGPSPFDVGVTNSTATTNGYIPKTPVEAPYQLTPGPSVSDSLLTGMNGSPETLPKLSIRFVPRFIHRVPEIRVHSPFFSNLLKLVQRAHFRFSGSRIEIDVQELRRLCEDRLILIRSQNALLNERLKYELHVVRGRNRDRHDPRLSLFQHVERFFTDFVIPSKKGSGEAAD